MAIALPSVAVEIAEFLQFLVVFFLERLDLRERSDVIGRCRQVRILDGSDPSS